MPTFNHLEAKVLPDRVLKGLAQRDHRPDQEGPRGRPRRVRLFGVLYPSDKADKEERLVNIVQHKHGSDRVELWELPSVHRQNAFHEGILVIGVLLGEVVDVLLEQASLVTDLQTVRQLPILLKANLLGHRAVEEWLGVVEAELVPEGGALPHELPLENRVQLFITLAFFVYFVLLHWFKFVQLYLFTKFSEHAP